MGSSPPSHSSLQVERTVTEWRRRERTKSFSRESVNSRKRSARVPSPRGCAVSNQIRIIGGKKPRGDRSVAFGGRRSIGKHRPTASLDSADSPEFFTPVQCELEGSYLLTHSVAPQQSRQPVEDCYVAKSCRSRFYGLDQQIHVNSVPPGRDVRYMLPQPRSVENVTKAKQTASTTPST